MEGLNFGRTHGPPASMNSGNGHVDQATAAGALPRADFNQAYENA